MQLVVANSTRTEADSSVAGALGLIDEWIGRQGPPGVGAVVWHRGRIAAERYVGEAQPGVPVDAGTLFALASVTKPVTAAVVMTLVEDGMVSLDEPVGRLVTAFRAGPPPGSDGVDPVLERLRIAVTARHLLGHTSGLPEDLGPQQSRYAEMVDLETTIEAMCRLPLQFAPGTALRYSNAGFAVLARLVERVTGRPFWEVAQHRVLDRLDLRDTVPRPGPSLAARLVRLSDTTHAGTELETYDGAYWRSLGLPWGGLFGTARDAIRFAASFLPSGPRLLSPAAVTLMTTDQAGGVAGGIESAKVEWAIARWGLGWEVKGDKRRHWTGELTSPATIAHFGHAGTLLWADPTHDLALAVFANRAVTHMWAFILARWARLSNAVVAAATAEL